MELRLLDVLDFSACTALLVQALHPGGGACPGCGSPPGTDVARARFLAGQAMRCPGCGRRWTAFSGTFLAGARLDPRQLAGMVVLQGLGLTDGQVGRLLGIDRSTATRWRSKLAAHGDFAVLGGDRIYHGGALDHSRLDSLKGGGACFRP